MKVALKRQGYQVIATSPYAQKVQSLVPLQAKPVALVVGNETSGIADDIVRNADIVVQIPMSGQIESLNVGVATGISLYELKFRMVLTMLINYIRANLGREVNVTGILIQQAFDTHIRQSSQASLTMNAHSLSTISNASSRTATPLSSINFLAQAITFRHTYLSIYLITSLIITIA